MSHIPPPQDSAELLQRSLALAGLRLGEIARIYDYALPSRPRQAKGWTGQLLEYCLGATAGSAAEPDFQAISVELKTIPVNQFGQPRESTYVCMVPLDGVDETSWHTSWVRRKLARVMWLPIESGNDIPFEERRVGTAILWSPDPQQEHCLQTDWEEHMELIQLGRIEEISAHHGTCLQIRPKAANRHALRTTTNEVGEQVKTLPRGFYLRPRFTAGILQAQYA
jgi:DNA mismatch repair protein MutH